MKEYLLKKKKIEFIKAVTKWKNLPKVWKAQFENGEDMRLWFDNISRLESQQSFVEEVKKILKNYNVKILTDEDKKIELLAFVKKYHYIPKRGEKYFSDNSDMYTWYMIYKKTHDKYETIVIKYLKEYQDFDLDPIWPDIKNEFINIIKKLKRVPEYGEAIFSNYNIDVRVVYEKLETYNKPLYEKVLLHLETYKDKSLSIEERVNELKLKVAELGYIPMLGESRFTDGTDMLTWYTKYKKNFPYIFDEISPYITEKKDNQVNIYTVPPLENTGKFYDVYVNIGETLDLSEISSYEKPKQNKTVSFTDIKKGIIK